MPESGLGIRARERCSHGGEEIWQTEIQPSREQGRGTGDASTETRHVAERQGRERRQGEESQAGDRDRTIGGPQERKEGPAQAYARLTWRAYGWSRTQVRLRADQVPRLRRR